MVEQNLRLAGGQGRQPRQRWRESASLDALVRRRHAQTSQLDLDSQDSHSSLGQGCSADACRLFDRGSPHVWKPVGDLNLAPRLVWAAASSMAVCFCSALFCRNVLEGFFALTGAWALQMLAAVGPLHW